MNVIFRLIFDYLVNHFDHAFHLIKKKHLKVSTDDNYRSEPERKYFEFVI